MFAGGLPHHYATLRSGELFGWRITPPLRYAP